MNDKLIQKLDKIESRHRELERLVISPEVASDHQRYTSLVKELGQSKKLVDAYRKLKGVNAQLEEAEALLESDEKDEELLEMAADEAEELRRKEEELAQRIRKLIFIESADNQSNAILEIRAGTGGEEAALFAGDLLRMYLRYAENEGLKTRILDSSPTDIGGYRDVVVAIEGDGAFGKFRFESGGHRVQRVPVTESGGRIHTSLVTVAVMREPEAVEVDIDMNDVQMDFYCASGPGGQKVNKTSSAVRLTHLPTGTIAQCQDCPSQRQNREQAMRVLRSRIYEKLQEESQAARDKTRRDQIGSGDRSGKVRTYNFPQNRVTDHRINLTLHNLQNVLDGDFQEIVDALNEDELARSEAEFTRG